jgi:hypothetical protein
MSNVVVGWLTCPDCEQMDGSVDIGVVYHTALDPSHAVYDIDPWCKKDHDTCNPLLAGGKTLKVAAYR